MLPVHVQSLNSRRFPIPERYAELGLRRDEKFILPDVEVAKGAVGRLVRAGKLKVGDEVTMFSRNKPIATATVMDGGRLHDKVLNAARHRDGERRLP
jgi:hypothetical protein